MRQYARKKGSFSQGSWIEKCFLRNAKKDRKHCSYLTWLTQNGEGI